MKRISLYALALVAATQMLAVSATAQDKKEQIIIRKKGDKKEKTTIIIEGDKITVNGKPLENSNEDIIVERLENGEAFNLRVPRKLRYREPREFYRFDMPDMMPQEDFMKEFKFDFKQGPLLGVVTAENEKGALIEEVKKETAADKAGFKKGDILTKVDDQTIKNPSDLVAIIATKKPNDEVEITYLREGKQKKTKVKLGESQFPQELFERNFEMQQEMFQDKQRAFQDKQRVFQDKQFEFQMMEPFAPGAFGDRMLFIHDRPQLGATIQDTEEGNGVKVLEVDTDSPAAKNGLQKDDLITAINGQKIENVGQAREALFGKNEKNTWSLKVVRAGNPVNIEIKIPKKLKKADL